MSFEGTYSQPWNHPLIVHEAASLSQKSDLELQWGLLQSTLLYSSHWSDGAKSNSSLTSCIESKSVLLPLLLLCFPPQLFTAGTHRRVTAVKEAFCEDLTSRQGDKMSRTHTPILNFSLSDFTWMYECLKILTVYYNVLTPTESNSTNSTHFNPSFKHAFNLDFSTKH